MGKCQRTPPLLLALLILLHGCATPRAANDPALATGAAQRNHLGLQLERPDPGQRIRQPSPLVEVRGRAGSLPFVASDVVILIDRSTISVLASGIDVDADGVVGRNLSVVTEWEPFERPVQMWTTDSDDTNHALQLKIVRALVPRLAARQNRVGLASSTFRARTNGTSVVRLTKKPDFDVPVGDPDIVLRELEDFPAAFQRRRTDLARLLEHGAELLEAATPSGEPMRPRVLLLLSLGPPSGPSGLYWSSQSAIERAGELAERGISVWAIPINSPDPDFLSDLTRIGGGNVLPIDRLDAHFGEPATRDLRPRELEIENVTKDQLATSLTVFPDGRFEAAVPLDPGPNTLEIRAVLADGRRTTLRRVVHYEVGPSEPNAGGSADQLR